MTQQERATLFHQLHRAPNGQILVLPNAWDAMSARLIEHAGASAIATTSCGVSWALGRPDGEGLTRAEMMEAIARIVRTVRVPVTADVESGYGNDTVADVAKTASGVIDAGAVGINLEDAPGRDGRPLLEVQEQAERIAAARQVADAAGVALFINARIDVYMTSFGQPEERVDETLLRAKAYVQAGADGVFVPALSDLTTIGKLARAVGVPLNIMATPGAPSIAQLREAGVARVSLGPAIVKAVMAQVRRSATEVLLEGTYDSMQAALSFAEADALFERSR